ncbi:unnamed protein product [Boreogadus saida]
MDGWTVQPEPSPTELTCAYGAHIRPGVNSASPQPPATHLSPALISSSHVPHTFCIPSIPCSPARHANVRTLPLAFALPATSPTLLNTP